MNVVLLSRLQFAVTAYAHLLFFPLAVGLAVLVAWSEWRARRTDDPAWGRIARWWGRPLALATGLTLVTGLAMDLQLGTNWGGLAGRTGDLLGPLRLGTTGALAAFATAVTAWIARPRPGRAVLAASAALVALWWSSASNALLQHPVAGLAAALTQRYALGLFLHGLGAALALAGFAVAAGAAWHLARSGDDALQARALRLGVAIALAATVAQAATGTLHLLHVRDVQPAKAAALGLAAAAVAPDAMPPARTTALGFRAMAGCGVPMLALAAWALAAARGPRPLAARRALLRALSWSALLPLLAIVAGWTLAEVGRQPWTVYGVLKTDAAVSLLRLPQVAWSLFGLLCLWTALAGAAAYAVVQDARRGPGGEN